MKAKRIFAFLLAAALTATTFVACDNGTSESKTESSKTSSTANKEEEESPLFNKTGMPIVNEPVTYKMMTQAGGAATSTVSTPDKEVFIKFQEETGVNIDWEEVVTSAWSEKTNLMLNSSQQPDAVLGGIDYAAAIDAEMLIAYDDYMEYAPNLEKMFETTPEVEMATRFTGDGKHYYYGGYADKAYSAVENPVFINKEWLKLVDKDMPTTTDEFADVLQAFKDYGDLNGNGIDDEVPLGFAKFWGGYDMCFMFGSWGLMEMRGPDNYIKFTINDGKLDLNCDDERYREALTYYHELFAAGLMHPDAMTMDATTKRAYSKGEFATVGVLADWDVSSAVAAENCDQYELLLPLAGPDGTQLFPRNANVYQVVQGLSIFNTAENPEILVRWMDHWNDAPWNIRIRYGMEGTYWDYSEDKTEIVFDNEHPDVVAAGGKSQYRANVAYLNGFANSDPDFCGVSDRLDDIDAAKAGYSAACEEFLFEEVWPAALPVSVKTDESDAVNLLKTDFTAYLQSFMSNAVLNGISDKEWQAHLDALPGYEVDRMIAFWQAQYDDALNAG